MTSLSAALAVAAATAGIGNDQWSEDSPMVSPFNSATECGECDQHLSTDTTRRKASLSTVILASVGLASATMALATILGTREGSHRSYLHHHRASQPEMMGAEEHRDSVRRSFVCITGQLERLELDNKIGSVLGPLRAAGYEPDVALVLDDSSLRVTNAVGPKGVDFAYAPAYGSFANAVDTLRDLDFRVVTDSPYIQSADPIINERYVQTLQQKAGMSIEQHRERSKNNVRMMESWQQCYAEMMSDIERSMTYDVIVRVREDGGFLEALDIEFLMRELGKAPRTVISNGCRTSHGMNDKAAIVSRDAARSYFLSPLQYYYTKPISDNVVSSESFIYYTYLEEKLSLLQPPEIRSVVKLVTDENGNTKLFPGEKKTLIHMCRVRVDHDDTPSNCRMMWDAENRDLQGVIPICWAHSVKDPDCSTCK